MIEKETFSNQENNLRRQAEEKAAQMINTLKELSPEETRRMLHELRVHQIELEMQNDELRQSQEDLDVARAKYFDLYDMAPVGYFTVSDSGMILEANFTAATLVGMNRVTLVKQPISRFIHKEDQDLYYLILKRLFETGIHQTCELRMVQCEGAEFWAHMAASISDGACCNFVSRIVISDITERKQAEDKIQQMSFHDFQTGLPNRKLLSDRLGVALIQAKRNKHNVGIAMLDLDNFKDVNDTLGHDIGDILLKAAAERLSEALRKGDTVARFGGDEFVLVFPDINVIEDMIHVVHKIIDSFHRPFLIDTHKLVVTTSIGIAVYPNDGIDERNLLKNADIAMYQAKKAGRARYQLYCEA